MDRLTIMLGVFINLLYTYCQTGFGDTLSGSWFDFENLTQNLWLWHMRTSNKWPQKCDGGPYNGADSVHCFFVYIYIKELPIYKKESGCIPPGFGDTLSGSWFDFENLKSVLMIQDWLIYIMV